MSKDILKVGLDAGHAGFNKTAGKRTPDGEFEWDFNNIVVSAMEKEFAKYEGIETLRVDDRTGKRDVPLRERTDLVNDWKAHIFISYHHNALTGQWGDWTGTETYTYNGKNVSAESAKLAKIVNDAIVEEYKLKNRGLKKANFHIVREANMPTILAEGAYMDSRIDIKVMRDRAILEKTGARIAKRVAESYGKKLKVVAKPVKPSTQPNTDTKYRVQVGAFKDIAGVVKYAKAVEDKTGYTTYITEVDGWLKVQVGAFVVKKGADTRLASVKKAGYKDAFVTTKSGNAVSLTEPQNEPAQSVVKPPVVAPKPSSNTTNLKSKKVTINAGAKTYATGGSIPSRVKGVEYTVQDDRGDRVLIKEIISVVFKKDVTVIGIGDKPKQVAPKPAPAKPKAKKFNLPTTNYWSKTPQFNGSDVKVIQQALASIYFYPERGAKNNGVDGWYGAKTADAVKRFQLMYGLKADGIYGAKTRNKLDSIVNK